MNGTVFPNRHAEPDPADNPNLSVYNASSVSEIRAALAALHKKDVSVTAKLDALVAAQKDLQRELGRLDIFRTSLGTQAAKTRSISHSLLADASSSAHRISSAVKKLDLEQSRVKATLTVVEQVRELKACVLGVSGSMGAPQDWETAAGYLSRASKLHKDVIEGEFAARVVPTAEVPDSPQVTLEAASESLCGLFLREFDKAIKENDGGKITRFFKLFPLINRSEVGLDVYGRYVCQGVATRARVNLYSGPGNVAGQDGFFYANALSRLFEHIAQIIDGHGGLVERHYGPGKMARVIERLQVEADLQGGIILDTWSDERRVDRHLTDIKSYAYTFLVQSFLPISRGTGTPRTNSPVPIIAKDDEIVDMKQIDALLNEMTNMLGKWALYTKFVSDKCSTATEDKNSTIPRFLLNSTLMKKAEDKLLGPFNIMTTFFFRRSVEKAFQLDEQPADLSLNPHKKLNSNPPHVTSAIEDIMYIVNKVLQQTLETSQRSVATSIIATLSRVMGSDFLVMEQRKMSETYPRAATQGALPPEHSIVSFIVLLNNLDIAKDYIEQIARTRLESKESQALDSLFLAGPEDAEAVASALKSFSSTFSEKTEMLIEEGLMVIFNNVMKPKLRPILLDAFRDADYSLSAEDMEDFAHERGEADGMESFSEEVRMRFQHGWDALTKPIARIMSERTFDRLLTQVINYFSKLLEKRLWTYQGRVNQSGASRLEHDINNIIRVVVAGQKYSYREAFLRCSQICMIMNMDDEEWEDIQAAADSEEIVADKLKPDERMRARNMIQ